MSSEEKDYFSDSIILDDEEESDSDSVIVEEVDSSFSEELKEIDNQIYKGMKYKKLEKAFSSKTPVKFVYYINEKFISVFEEMEKGKDIVYNLNKLTNIGIKIQPKEFIFVYYIFNKTENKKKLVENFNQLSSFTGEEYFTEAFDEYKEAFDEKFKYLLEQTNKEFLRFEEFYKKVEGLKFSQEPDEIINTFNVSNTTVEYNATENSYPFDRDNAFIIFDSIKLNGFFNFMRLDIVGKESYYKVFNKSSNIFENLIELNNTITSQENRLYIFYKLKFKNKIFVDYVQFDLDESKLIINYKSQTLETILKKLREIIPNLSLERETKKNISGEFEILFNNYDELKFYYLTLFEDIFSEFFFVREDASPRSLKENIKFYYVGTDQIRSYLNYSIYFNMKKLYSNKYIITFTSKSTSQELIKEFIIILSKLIYYYNEIKKEDLQYLKLIEEPYTGINGEGLGGDKKFKTGSELNLKAKKIENLLTSAPELFTKYIYSRNCPCPKQPIIIDEEDVPDWSKYQLDGDKRNVVLFPPEESKQKVPKRYYVCPDDTFKNFSFKENSDKTSDYPLVPCCNISKFPEKLYQDYDKIRANPTQYWFDKEEFKGKSNTILKTLKILKNDRLGFAPEYLTNLFDKIGNYKVIREGCSKSSKSSLLHAVMKTMKTYETNITTTYDDSKTFLEFKEEFIQLYHKTTESEIRESYCYYFRKTLFDVQKFIKIENCYQEMFSYPEEEILEIFKEFNETLESNQFYKILEIFFAINIFVFVYNRETEEVFFEVPDHQYYHNREIKLELPCIFILKHQLENSFNVYELIRTKESMESFNSPYIFDNKVTKYMKNYIETFHTYYFYENNEIYKNSLVNVNWNLILKDYRIHSQIINNSGRCYCINIEYKKNKFMSLFIKESFPLNAKITTEIFSVKKKEAVEVLGEDYLLGDMGIWYKLNSFKFGVFVPCEDIKEKSVSLLICKNFRIVLEKNNKTDVLTNLSIVKKNTKIYLQLIKWLYLLEQDEPEKWVNKFMVLDMKQEKELFVGEVFRIEYRFPKMIKTVEEGIKYLNQFIPRIFSEKIFLYEELYHSTVQNLKNFYRANYDLPLRNKSVITDLLISEDDFKVYNFNKILIGKNYSFWKNTYLEREIKNLNIIRYEDNELEEPFIWINEKNYYFVKNNKALNFTVALFISKIWRIGRVALDYKTENFSIWRYLKNFTEKQIEEYFGWSEETIKNFIYTNITKNIYFKNFINYLDFLVSNRVPYKQNIDYSYIVYSSKGSKIEIIERNIVDEGDPLEIYYYPGKGFCSLLPIN